MAEIKKTRLSSIRMVMGNLTQSFSNAIAGKATEATLEIRSYNFACFIGTVACLIATVANALLDMALVLTITTMAATMIFLYLYYLSRSRGKVHKWTGLMAALLTLSLAWFVNQGSQGPIIFGYFLASTGFLLVGKPAESITALLLIYLDVALLFFLENRYPDLIFDYPSDEIRKMDIYVSIVFTMIFCNLFVLKVKAAYGQERRELRIQTQLKAALEESEKKFRIFFNALSDPVFVHPWLEKGFGRFIEVNDAACRRYGYTREEFSGLSTLDITDRKAFLKHAGTPDRNDLATHGFKVYETTHKDRNGITFPVEISASYLELNRQKIIIAVIRDISRQKQAQELKKQLQEKLQHSQKMESIGTLAGGIAHDFNNILQAISGYADISLADKAPDDPDCDNLNQILNASERAKKLIQQLLFFSRKAEISRRPININREILQAKAILEKTIPKMITIRTELAENLWNANADPVQIEQVILNLGSNAAHAMPEGGSILITTSNEYATADSTMGAATLPVNHILLTVSDTGTGMDRETLEKIFEPFFTTKELGKGTGLGLASVYGIVKSHDGHITCSSTPGMGTCFQILLPVLNVDPEDETLPETRLTGGSQTVLVVDDELQVREIASKILKRFGYTVLTAVSGEEALDVYTLNSRAIDLVILDINMPGMGGIKCLEQLLNKFPDSLVIMASGYSEHDHALCLDLGARGYITKPYRLAELVGTIENLMAEHITL